MWYVRCFFITLLAIPFSGCLQKGSTDSVPIQGAGGGGGGGTTPVTYSWPFDFGTTASYTFNATKIDFTGGVCRLTANDQLDDSNAASGFGGGTLSGTAWDATNSYVRLDQSGTPTNTAELDSSWAPEWASLIGYWKFNETVGATLADSSPSARDITAASVTVGQTGKLGKATQITSSTSTLTATNIPASGTELTLSLWMYGTSTPGIYQSLVCKGVNCASYQLYLAAGTGYLSFYNLASGLVTPVNPVALNEWVHVAITLAGGTVTFYVNGAQTTTGAATINDGATAGLQVGNFNNSNPLVGTLDDLSIWSKALTAAQIQTIYSRQSAKYSGTFTSRVMDAYAAGQSWTTLSWESSLPFGKPLPDSGANELSADYASLFSNTLMNNILVYYRFDETVAGTAPAAEDFIDYSGNGYHGTASAAPTYGVNGIQNKAVSITGGATYVNASLPALGNNWTIASWFKYPLPSNCSAYCTLVRGSPNDHHVLVSPTLKLGNYDNGTFTNFHDSGFSMATLSNGWHHLAAVNSNTGSTEYFIDGVSVGSANWATSADIFAVGNWQGGGQPFGPLDEFAVWTRSLSATEIQQLARRSDNRVKHQVRSCSVAACADDPTGANWKGPDGTNQTYFSELYNRSTQAATPSGTWNTAGPSMLFSNFTAPPGTARYFQYRTILESDHRGTSCNYGSGATWCSPEVSTVTVDPVHYDSSAPTIYGNNGLTLSGLTSFAETIGASCTSGVGYNLSLDKITWYYWNGAVWVASNGTAAQSNSAAVISTNAAALGTQVGTGTVYFKAYLQSSGSSACELSDVQLDGTI